MTLYAPWSLRGLVADLASSVVTEDSVRERSRRRIARTEPEIAAWVAHAEGADASDGTAPDGPLRGVPFGVKDIIDVAGHPTRLGSALHDAAPPSPTDAAVVSAWRAAGAVPSGKTVTAEFAFFTPGPTRNPVRPTHTPGSSSSGSAAAVGAGQVPLAIGTQTGGSTTRPASYCGVASLTMAPGRIPSRGVYAMSPTLDSHGVFAASVSDLALAWSALGGGEDVGATPPDAPRLLLWTGQSPGPVSPAMADAVAHAAESLRRAGAVVDAALPDALVADLVDAHGVVLHYEMGTACARELAIADRLGPQWIRVRERSRATSSADHEHALDRIAAAREALASALSGYDAVIGPAATGAAPPGLTMTGDPAMSLPWQAVGMPAVAVPGLRDRSGLPLGLQVVAVDEGAALRAGVWAERHLTGTARGPGMPQ